MATFSNATIGRLIADATRRLSFVSDSAKLDAELLLCRVLNCSKTYLLTWPEREVSVSDSQSFFHYLERREVGEPIAYLLGEKEFWSMNFKVSPATLIPRPDTEVLVEVILNNHRELVNSVLDLGTGTGAIAIALANENPDWKITAVDFIAEAVELAKENATNLLSTGNVDIKQSDWFSALTSNQEFDVIVSNPPYIDNRDQHLNEGDVRFEPRSALVAENNGLADIEHISANARDFLKSKGWLYFEHGFEQAACVQAILKENNFINVETFKDYNGNDRVTRGQLDK